MQLSITNSSPEHYSSHYNIQPRNVPKPYQFGKFPLNRANFAFINIKSKS